MFYYVPTTYHRLSIEILFNLVLRPTHWGMMGSILKLTELRTVSLGQMYILIRGTVGIQTTSRRSSLGGGVRTADLPRMTIILCKLYAFLHFFLYSTYVYWAFITLRPGTSAREIYFPLCSVCSPELTNPSYLIKPINNLSTFFLSILPSLFPPTHPSILSFVPKRNSGDLKNYCRGFMVRHTSVWFYLCY